MKKSLCVSISVVFIFCACFVGISMAAEEDNPMYQDWARFKAGSFVTYKTRAETSGVVAETEMTYTLKEVTPEKLLLEIKAVTITAGIKVDGPVEMVEVPAKGKTELPENMDVTLKLDSEETTTEGVEEEIEIKGQKIKTTRITATVKETDRNVTATAWYTDEIPGRLVKSSTVTDEIVATKVERMVIDFKIIESPEGDGVVDSPEGTVVVDTGTVSVESPEGTVNINLEELSLGIEGVNLSGTNILVDSKEGFIQGLSAPVPDISAFAIQGSGIVIDANTTIDPAALDQMPKVGVLILFDTNLDTIKAESKPSLRQYGGALQNELQDAVLVVAGHTDSRGSDEYNLDLSRRRAEAIKQFLIAEFQIATDRLIVFPFGETKPIATNDTAEGRAQNRRVEFIRVK